MTVHVASAAWALGELQVLASRRISLNDTEAKYRTCHSTASVRHPSVFTRPRLKRDLLLGSILGPQDVQ